MAKPVSRPYSSTIQRRGHGLLSSGMAGTVLPGPGTLALPVILVTRGHPATGQNAEVRGQVAVEVLLGPWARPRFALSPLVEPHDGEPCVAQAAEHVLQGVDVVPAGRLGEFPRRPRMRPGARQQ